MKNKCTRLLALCGLGLLLTLTASGYIQFYIARPIVNDRGYDAIRRIFMNSIFAHSALNPTRAAAD